MLFNTRNKDFLTILKRCFQSHKRCFNRNVPTLTVSREPCENHAVPLQKFASAKSDFYFHNEWPADIKQEFQRDMILVEDFISESEEKSLIDELEQVFKRMRYEYDHWDDAIHGYRECQKNNWYPQNRLVLDRVANLAFETGKMAHIHILDLAKNGVIKPHVDSSRYCGNVIAGLSLLTDCIMRLKRVDEKKYDQGGGSSYQVQQAQDENKEFDYYSDLLLKRRSLYVMKDSARYKFSHAVLATGEMYKGVSIDKDRRISIICRNDA